MVLIKYTSDVPNNNNCENVISDIYNKKLIIKKKTIINNGKFKHTHTIYNNLT